MRVVLPRKAGPITPDGSLQTARINRLIDDAPRDPFIGIGKPEQLRHALTGAWSRAAPKNTASSTSSTATTSSSFKPATAAADRQLVAPDRFGRYALGRASLPGVIRR
jgi:YoeB-like toxin of type II toxin-antitoxin system